MKNINEIKAELEKKREEYVKKLNERFLSPFQKEANKGFRYSILYNSAMIYIDSIQDDIVYWKSYPSEYTLLTQVYFYTDLEGKILFDESFFHYATPFSNSCALVNQNDDWYIIDLKSKEFVSFPNEIIPDNANGFVRGNLIIFNREKEHWGSYYYNREDKVFEQDIPFIWDALEFTENKDVVYVGMHDIYKTPVIKEGYYEKYLEYKEFYYTELNNALKNGLDTTILEPPGKIADLPRNSIVPYLDCQTIRFTIFKLEKRFAYDLNKYKEVLNLNEDDYYQKEVIRKRMMWYPDNTSSKRKEKKEDILYTLSSLNSFGDSRYIKDYNNEEFNNNGTIVDVGKTEDYQRVLGKLKK